MKKDHNISTDTGMRTQLIDSSTVDSSDQHLPPIEDFCPEPSWNLTNVDRAQKDLKLLALGMIETTMDNNFRNILNNKVGEKFDSLEFEFRGGPH